MIEERREAQASLYALSALPAEEVREFESALRTDLELQLLVRELRTAADAMTVAYRHAAPPPDLKEKIFAAIDSRGGSSIIPFGNGRSSAGQAWLPWALAACFALLCVALIGLGHSLRRQGVELSQLLEQESEKAAALERERNELLRQAGQSVSNSQQQVTDLQKQVVKKTEEAQRLKTDFEKAAQESQRQIGGLQRQLAQNSVEAERLKQELAVLLDSNNKDRFAQFKISVLNPTPDSPPRALGASIWDNELQRGVLVVESLAPLPADKDYQLWLFDPRFASPVSAGVFNVDERGAIRFIYKPGGPVSSVDRFAISVERKGGVPAPQGKVLLVSN